MGMWFWFVHDVQFVSGKLASNKLASSTASDPEKRAVGQSPGVEWYVCMPTPLFSTRSTQELPDPIRIQCNVRCVVKLLGQGCDQDDYYSLLSS